MYNFTLKCKLIFFSVNRKKPLDICFFLKENPLKSDLSHFTLAQAVVRAALNVNKFILKLG